MNSSKSTLHINLQIIQKNYNSLCKQCPNSIVSAAVKADAYGLGACEVSVALKEAGCKNFFVANCDEAIALRNFLGVGSYIYILNGVFKDQIDDVYKYRLIPVLNHLEQIKIWEDYAVLVDKKLACIIHVDSGMHRLGMPLDEVEQFNISSHAQHLDIRYVMSHLSSAEEEDKSFSAFQLDSFKDSTSRFSGIKKSLANSSGIFLGNEYHFDMVRSGAALYGINPTPYKLQTIIENPIALLTPIIQLQKLLPGQSVGYSRAYTNTTSKSRIIATIPVGYADGFFRALSNQGILNINGFETPIVGMINMDMSNIDVSDVPPQYLHLGSQVEAIGNNCTPDKIAKLCNTNSYEIITMLGNRYKRVYTKASFNS